MGITENLKTGMTQRAVPSLSPVIESQSHWMTIGDSLPLHVIHWHCFSRKMTELKIVRKKWQTEKEESKKSYRRSMFLRWLILTSVDNSNLSSWFPAMASLSTALSLSSTGGMWEKLLKESPRLLSWNRPPSSSGSEFRWFPSKARVCRLNGGRKKTPCFVCFYSKRLSEYWFDSSYLVSKYFLSVDMLSFYIFFLLPAHTYDKCFAQMPLCILDMCVSYLWRLPICTGIWWRLLQERLSSVSVRISHTHSGKTPRRLWDIFRLFSWENLKIPENKNLRIQERSLLFIHLCFIFSI